MKKMSKRILSLLLCLAMVVSYVPVMASAADGIVVQYTFDDGTANDSSGNGYNGTLAQGAAVTDGSVKLTGGSKTAATGVDIPNAAFKNLTNYTIEMDVKLDETVNWTQLFTMGDGSHYLVLANQGNPSRVEVGLTMAAKNGGGEQRVKSSSPSVKLPVGEWCRMTYTQSGNTATLYINGRAVGTSTITITPAVLADQNLSASIGRSLMFNDPGMKGLVDEFVIYNYGMTAAQVKESFDAKYGPILYYDFEDVDGTTVKDQSGNGYDATLITDAKVVESMDGNALSLSSGTDYLQMPDFLSGMTDVTFSGFVKLDQVSNWTTLFAAGVKGGKCITWAVKGDPGGNKVGYTLAINNGAGSEQRVAATTDHIMATGQWIHFVYAQKGASARLYLDGQQVESLSMLNNKFIDHGDNMTNTFSNVAGAGPLMLGKSVWPDPDAYGLFDEIRVYDRCLSTEEIQDITKEFEMKIALAGVDLGDVSRVTESIELPLQSDKDATVTWVSDAPEVLDATGKLNPEFQGQQTVTLTATVTLPSGQKADKVFVLNVQPYTEEEKAQVVLDEQSAYIEAAIDFLINDGYTLPTTTDEAASVTYTVVSGDAEIRDGKVYKTETSDERQALVLKAAIKVGNVTREVELKNITLIDAYAGYILSFFGANGTVDSAHSGVNNKDEKARLAYSYDGIHWATLNNNYPVVYPTQGSTKRVRDPFIMRNKDGSFTLLATQGWDTPYIYLWHSENLTEFTNERLLQVSQAGVQGLTGSRAWAPEADYDRITDQYYIYWADPSAGPIYYNTSKDLETVSDPAIYFDVGYQIIDSNIVKDGDTYYMAFKDERSSGKRMKFAKSNSLQPNTWEVYTPEFVTGMNSEGPFVYQDFNTGKWVMYWDFFYGATNERFGYSFADDLASGEWDYQGTNPYMPSTDVRHGGVVAVTQDELDAIIAKWNPSGEVFTIAEVEQFEAIEVPGNVAAEDLELPETVLVYQNNGKTYDLAVSWTSETYKAGVTGEYAFTGTLTLVDELTNPKNLTASITVKNLGAALEVIDLINAIGEVTLESEDKIDAAREAYDALPEEEVVNVTNYQTLVDAEMEYAVLVSGANAEEAKAAAEAAKAAQAAAEAAKAAAEAAQAKAEAAEAAAKEAEKNAGEDAAAAEAAKTAAENAKAAAQTAQAKAEAAQAAADAAAKAAAQSDAEAAQSAAAAAQDAADAAKAAGEAATSSAAAAEAAKDAQAAKAAAEAAQAKAEAAEAAAKEAEKNAGEDAAAAEAARTAAETAKALAEAAQGKAEAAQDAAEAAMDAAEESAEAAAKSNIKAAAEAAKAAVLAADAAKDAVKSAKSAEESAGYAADAAQSAQNAQAAQKAAEEAKATAEQAKKDAQAAKAEAEAAKNAAGDAQDAAEAERKAAEAAKTAAEAAQASAEAEKLAAEAAKAAAEAAQALAEAAQAAAKEDQLSAQAAKEAAEAAKTAAEAEKKAAEEARVAAEAAQAAAEEAKAAVDAAALDAAKVQAALNLDSYAQKLCSTEYLDEIVAEAKEAIEAAETAAEVQEILAQAKADMDGIAELCPSAGFADVIGGAWYHDYVDYMVEKGYMKGMSDTEFGVNGSVTRAQLVTILYRTAGEPDVEGLENPFEDVQEGTFYYNAVIWAASEGVVKGVTESEFAPAAAITREQIVTILYRYADAEAVEEDNLAAYTDAAEISAYAVEAMNWAIGEGVINGMTKTTLAPTETATRAQICAIMMRCLEK